MNREMMKYPIKKTLFLLLPFVFLLQTCGLYKLNQSSIPDAMKTISVQFFENTAPIVVPTMASQFTEALKDRIRNQTRLSLVQRDADANFEGRITDYSIRSEAVQANNIAGLVRLTITVSVKYSNSIDPKASFEESFSASKQFSIQSQSQQAQEPQLIRDVNTQLTENIFNRAFANW
jgi:hypothetical protein